MDLRGHFEAGERERKGKEGKGREGKERKERDGKDGRTSPPPAGNNFLVKT